MNMSQQLKLASRGKFESGACSADTHKLNPFFCRGFRPYNVRKSTIEHRYCLKISLSMDFIKLCGST